MCVIRGFEKRFVISYLELEENKLCEVEVIKSYLHFSNERTSTKVF